jgi:rare lipoprotein A (peptidoglycan hydrolase)
VALTNPRLLLERHQLCSRSINLKRKGLHGVFRLCTVLAIMLACSSVTAGEALTGIASFYSAVPPSSDKLTAAHRHFPFGTMVSVTRIDTGAHVVVRINDRGPFIKGRIIDLSRVAAEHLGLIPKGLARVRIQVVPAPERAVRTALQQDAPLRCSACVLPPILE